MSEDGFRNALKVLDTQDEVDGRTRLLPETVCQAVVARIDAENVPCDLNAAHQFTLKLIRNYPDLKPHDGKGYVLALDEIFAQYPATICAAVCDTNKGLPASLAFHPKSAQVKAACDAEKARIELIRANALWHGQERERRAKLRAAEAEYAHSKFTHEERKAQVDKLLGRGAKEFP